MQKTKVEYLYCECPACDFSLVVDRSKIVGQTVHCSLCASDNGRTVAMIARQAEDTDVAEGFDARKAKSPENKALTNFDGMSESFFKTQKEFVEKLSRPKFQARVFPWMLTCFGEQITFDGVERNHRFLEESLELVQALGTTKEEAYQLVDYVFGRPAGDPNQEAGGVMVTLAALGIAHGIEIQDAGEVELARIWTKIDKIRAKQAAKPKHGPLPE